MAGLSTEQPFPADCLQRFEPVRQLGRGGFGVVYLARQRALARDVAVKVLLSAALEDPEQARRFSAEAKITAALNHPHVVRVVDHGADTAVPWIAYEYLSGRSLRAHLDLTGPLDPREAALVTEQVADALSAAHALGIVHRDIKPDNVLRTDEGAWKVMDFGIARWAGANAVRTATGVILGTPAFIAPEVIRGAEPTASADLYALGVMLFELLTGQLPFQDDNPVMVLERHLKQPAPLARGRRPELPAWTDAVLARLLAKDPAGRFGSAAEVREALAAHGGPELPDRQLTAAPSRGARPRNDRTQVLNAPAATSVGAGARAPWGLAAALIAGTLIGGAGMALRRPPPVVAPTASPFAEVQPERPGPVPVGATFAQWRRVAPVLTMDHPLERLAQLSERIAVVPLGVRSLRHWQRWTQLGAWLESGSASWPPGTPTDVALNPGLTLPRTDPPAGDVWQHALHGLNDAPGDGRCWLLLAQLLRQEHADAAAARVSTVALDLLEPGSLAQAAPLYWRGFVAALLADPKRSALWETALRALANSSAQSERWLMMRELVRDAASVQAFAPYIKVAGSKGMPEGAATCIEHDFEGGDAQRLKIYETDGGRHARSALCRFLVDRGREARARRVANNSLRDRGAWLDALVAPPQEHPAAARLPEWPELVAVLDMEARLPVPAEWPRTIRLEHHPEVIFDAASIGPLSERALQSVGTLLTTPDLAQRTWNWDLAIAAAKGGATPLEPELTRLMPIAWSDAGHRALFEALRLSRAERDAAAFDRLEAAAADVRAAMAAEQSFRLLVMEMYCRALWPHRRMPIDPATRARAIKPAFALGNDAPWPYYSLLVRSDPIGAFDYLKTIAGTIPGARWLTLAEVHTAPDDQLCAAGRTARMILLANGAVLSELREIQDISGVPTGAPCK